MYLYTLGRIPLDALGIYLIRSRWHSLTVLVHSASIQVSMLSLLSQHSYGLWFHSIEP